MMLRLLILLLVLFASRTASASERGFCRAAAALTFLSKQNQQALQEACQKSDVPPNLARLATDELLLQGDNAALFLELLPAGALVDSSEARRQADAAIKAISREVTDTAKGGCAKLWGDTQRLLDRWLNEQPIHKASGQFTEVPFSKEELETKCKKDLPLKGYRLVFVFGNTDDKLQILSGGPDTLERIHVGTKLDMRRSRTVFVAAVREAVPFVVLHHGTGAKQSRRVARVDRIDRLGDSLSAGENSPEGCLEIEATSDYPDQLIFLLDGQPIKTHESSNEAPEGARTSAKLLLEPAQHKLVTLQAHHGRANVVDTKTISLVSHTYATNCASVKLDLRTGRTGLVGVRAGPECAGTGLDENLLELRATNFLRKSLGRQFVDLATLKSSAQGIASTTSLGRLFPARATGASRGTLGTEESAGAVLSEFLRQGLSRVILLDATCRMDAEQKRHTISIHASSLDLLDTQRHGSDDVAGLNLRDAIRGETETAHGEYQLRGAMISVLSRLLNLPYVRFYDHVQNRLQFNSNTLLTEAYIPPEDAGTLWKQEVRAEFASGAEMRTICDVLDERDRLRAPEWERNVHLDLLLLSKKNKTQGTIAHDQAEFGPARVGGYVIGISAVFPDGKELVDYECVRVGSRYGGIWASLGSSTNSASLIAERSVALQYSQLLVGIPLAETHLDSAFQSSGSLVVGYGRSQYQINAPPSWDDLVDRRDGQTAITIRGFDEEGNLRQTWVRHSLLLGLGGGFSWAPWATMEKRSLALSPYARRVDLNLRAIAFLDLGFIDASTTNPGLREFRGGKSNDSTLLNASMTGIVELAVRLNIGAHSSLRMGDAIALLGPNDALFSARRGDPAFRQITLTGAFANMIVFGAEYHR